MHVDIQPRQLELMTGVPTPVTITISNTGDVIGGYRVRFLGADPRWVQLPDEEISLFPEESRVVTALLTVPEGLGAGERRIAVQVSELTPPNASVVEELVLQVPYARSIRLAADPASLSAGRAARYNLLLENTGNTELTGYLHGQDAEGKVSFRFSHPQVQLLPGEHAVIELKARAKQQFMGSPMVRVLDLHLLDEPPTIPVLPPAPRRGLKGRLRRAPKPKPRVSDEKMPDSQVTFLQHPFVARGLLAMFGLLAAVTIFALVISVALSRIVGQSAADRNLALEIAAARDAAANSGTASMSGIVRLLTSGKPVPGVAVNVFPADDTETPVATTATGPDGVWSAANLAAGKYKVTFRGAGFVQLWYPRSVESTDGVTIELSKGMRRAGLDVDLGGVPASIAGTVVGDDVSTATLSLRTPLPDTTGLSGISDKGALVKSVPVGSDGTFTLTDVPSPSVYDLVVQKKGFATSTQRVDVGAGEERTGVEITLRRGDGVISGLVNGPDGPLPGASVQVTSGTTSVTSMTLTEGDVGSFNVRSLPTPGTFTIVATKPEYASVTQTITLAAGQRLTGVSMTLNKSSGSLRGIVRSLPFNTPTGGVLVSVTDGQTTVQTATQSQEDVGSWRVDGLAVPGTYTITFSRADLAAQTISAALDSGGGVSSQSAGASVGDKGLRVTMQPSSATVEGRVRQRVGSGTRPIGEVTVSLSSSTANYTVTTASVPADNAGRYRIEGVPPGTYTVSVSRGGVTPTSTLLVLKAGEVRTYSPILAEPASITGSVVQKVGGASVGAGWFVEIYRSSGYPGTLYRTTKTDASGSFTFDDVDAPEAYVIQVRRTEGSSPAGSVSVQVGRSKSVHVTVKADTDD